MAGQEIYFKSIDDERVTDSITKIIDATTNLRITFQQLSYWNSRKDTTLNPNLFYSSFTFYLDSSGASNLIITNPYVTYGPIFMSSEALNFVKYNGDELAKTELRPNHEDIYVDSTELKELLIKFPKIPLQQAIEMSTKEPKINWPADGGSIFIEISVNKIVSKFYFPVKFFENVDEWYKFNSKQLLFPLYLLLEKDRKYALNKIESEKVYEESKKLEGIEKYEWLIRDVELNIEKLKRYEKELRNELRKIE